MKRFLVTVMCCAVVLSGGRFAARAADDSAAEGETWWMHVKILAHDNMEGRNTGSEGFGRAADYVAGEFRDFGLKPAGTSGYFQNIDFRVRQIDESKSSLELVRDGKVEPLSLSDDANLALPADFSAGVTAQAVFVGNGLVIPEMHIDDLAGIDLKDKVAVILAGGPKDIPGVLKAHYAHPKQQWGALKRAGAVGIVRLANPKSMDIPWSRATLARLNPVMSLADSKLDDSAGMKLSVRFNPASAEKLFAGSGHTFAELLALADNNQPLPKFALPVTVRAKVAAKKKTVTSMNIAGVLRGSDPQLRNEYVVLSAHLDHLGIGQPINGDSIYNGAMDNASGVASLLQMAQWITKSNTPPKRSLIFLALTGEEKGLLGSRYFASHPTVPAKGIVADLNMDMFLPIHPLKIVRGFGLNESSLGGDLQAVCDDLKVAVQPDPEPDRNIFIRSDQYSFVRQGVPSLFFAFGFEPGTPEEKLHKDWLANRYHAPSDDVNQPVDKAAAAKYNHILLSVAERVANAPDRPHWNPDSFFKRFEK